MEPSAATAMHLVPSRQSGLASWIGRRWRIAAVAGVIVIVAVVMLTGGRRPSIGLTGRGSSVVAVTFGPDNKIIAAADEEGFIYLWQTATGERITTLRSPRGAVVDAIAFSPDGKLLATGDNLDAYQPTGTPARTYLWDVSWLP